MRATFFLGLILVAACGSGRDPSPTDAARDSDATGADAGDDAGTRIVAAAGGMVASDDGLFVLEIPPGALDRDTTFAIRKVPTAMWPSQITAMTPASGVYEVTPSDARFSPPATRHILYPTGSPVLDAGGCRRMQSVARSDDGSTDDLPTTAACDLAAGSARVSAPIAHPSMHFDRVRSDEHLDIELGETRRRVGAEWEIAGSFVQTNARDGDLVVSLSGEGAVSTSTADITLTDPTPGTQPFTGALSCASTGSGTVAIALDADLPLSTHIRVTGSYDCQPCGRASGDECDSTGGCGSAESCDDTSCTCVSNCGNGVLDTGEACDPETATDPCVAMGGTTRCTESCECRTDPVCGDGTLEAPEDCEPSLGCSGGAECDSACHCRCEDSFQCDDFDECTTDECTGNRCIHGEIATCCRNDADCADPDPCTSDMCSASVCMHEPIFECCHVDSECTPLEPCSAGVCLGSTCSSVPISGCCSDDFQCEDGNLCTSDRCTSNRCQRLPVAGCCGSDGDCSDSDPCTTDRCDSASGSCMFERVDEDFDGYGPDACGGDCNDQNGEVHAGQSSYFSSPHSPPGRPASFDYDCNMRLDYETPNVIGRCCGTSCGSACSLVQMGWFPDLSSAGCGSTSDYLVGCELDPDMVCRPVLESRTQQCR